MTEPATYPAPSEWYCDRCQQTITDPDRSLVVWRTNEEYRDGGYLVVHKGKKCDPGSSDYTNSQEISTFLGWDGQAYLLPMLSVGTFHMEMPGRKERRLPTEMNRFVDLFRRMQTPYYEKARRHFTCQTVKDEFSDANPEYIYRPETLRRIAAHDGDCQED